jgi:MFS family permease
MLNYLDRQMLAAMKTSIAGDIPGISNKENWGLVLAVFKWVYALLSPFGGYVSDRFSRRHVISLSLLIWSAVTWATAWVTTYEQLLWLRALMGISEAFYIPAALALITDYHPGPTRSRAVGLHQAGIYTGLILGDSRGTSRTHRTWAGEPRSRAAEFWGAVFGAAPVDSAKSPA